MEKPCLIEKLPTEGEVPERLLGIFVKQPVAGQVKTRLCPPLTPDEAARLYAVAMRETIERTVAGSIPVVLFYDGTADYFATAFPDLPLWPQQDGDLGARMIAAFDMLLGTGCRAAALIGSDSPDLPYKQVEAAFDALGTKDAVTMPAADGGYVLVGCSRPCPDLFTKISWSSGAVAEQTRQRAEQAGLRYAEVGSWSDIDDIEALQALLQRTPGSATSRFVRQMLAHRLPADCCRR